jgi:dihydroxyacetone kinase
VERAWAGNFMTALEMPGCSLSLMVVDDARLEWLDASVEAPAWPGGGRVGQRKAIVSMVSDPVVVASDEAGGESGSGVRRAALAAAGALEREETVLTELDSRAGDGDLGLSMARGAAAIRAMPDEAWGQAAAALAAMGNVVRRAIAGSSGPFYATALLRAGRELGPGAATPETWARAFAGAVASVAELGGAKRGDRSMLDALEPASEAFGAALQNGATLSEGWRRAVAAAEEGTAATAAMHPRVGRAAYLGERAMGAPDAGATAVLVWMRAIAAEFG